MAREITYLRCSRFMKYKQYANMVSFLHHSCGSGVLETAGIGAAPLGKETGSSKDVFLWTLALHLHRLQRVADPMLEPHEVALVHRWFTVHKSLLFPTKKTLMKETPQVRLSSSCQHKREDLNRPSTESLPLRTSYGVHRRSFTAPPLVPRGTPTSAHEYVDQSHDGHMTPPAAPSTDTTPERRPPRWSYSPLRPLKRSDFSQVVFQSSTLLAIDVAMERLDSHELEAIPHVGTHVGGAQGGVSPDGGATTVRQVSEMDDIAESKEAGLERWIQGLDQGVDMDYVNPPYHNDDVIRVSMATTNKSRKLFPLLEEEEEEEEVVAKPSTKSRFPVILPTVTLGFTTEGHREEGEGSSLLQQTRVPKKLVPVVAGFRVERYALRSS